ncbi:hypothetical protein Ciccas_002031 [Cichlidogyrus casuarinus]|uniref:Uncharacterized protein n=1 Tax=Cichlidogyrus casuarinus TaxID=1844966 RepID=A0ABD2QID4_9PLAT
MSVFTAPEAKYQKQARILGAADELDENKCNPPTLWSYLYDDQCTKQEEEDQIVIGGMRRRENERKRKFIKIYAQDELMFKQYHEQEAQVNATLDGRVRKMEQVGMATTMLPEMLASTPSLF